MKNKLIFCVITCVLTIVFCSCSSKAEEQSFKTISVTDCVNGKLSFDNEQTSETEIINKYKNLKASEEFTLRLPAEINYISNFSYSSPEADSNKSFFEQFKEIFSYIFDDVEFDDSCMYYEGASSNLEYDENGEVISDFKTVAEMYDKIVSDDEYVFDLFYNDLKSQSENRAFMIFQSPICSGGLSGFNRGEFSKRFHIDDNIRYDLELSYPQLEILPSEIVEPESKKTVRVDEKDIAIADAVELYENFVNSLPYPTKSNVFTRVAEVDILPFENSTNNCIGFITTIEYNHILFDYTRQGIEIPNDWSFILGLGAMVKPDEIDSAYGIYRYLNIIDENKYDKMIPFESAVQVLSENLTKEITFDVLDASLVYSSKAPESYERGKDIREVSTAWKFKLYNGNDNKYYMCYVDAATGDNFRYYARTE